MFEIDVQVTAAASQKRQIAVRKKIGEKSGIQMKFGMSKNTHFQAVDQTWQACFTANHPMPLPLVLDLSLHPLLSGNVESE